MYQMELDFNYLTYKHTVAQFIYEISPLIYIFIPIPIMGKNTIANPHIFYSHFLNRC